MKFWRMNKIIKKCLKTKAFSIFLQKNSKVLSFLHKQTIRKRLNASIINSWPSFNIQIADNKSIAKAFVLKSTINKF